MIALLAALAFGQAPCTEAAMPVGPVTAGLLDGDLGEARSTCAFTEVGLTAGGLLLADAPHFYGHIVAGAAVEGSLALDTRTALFGAFEVVRYDAILSPFPSGYLGLGHLSLGAQHAFSDKIGVNGKVVLPTALGLYDNAAPLALDAGLAWRQHLTGGLRTYGQLSVLWSAMIGPGPALHRVGAAPTAGLEWWPVTAFAAAAEVKGLFGYTSGVDVVAAAIALRTGGKRVGGELGVTLPFAGRDRTLATLDLRLFWRH